MAMVVPFLFFLHSGVVAQAVYQKRVRYFEGGPGTVKEIYFVNPRKPNLKNGPYTSFYMTGVVKARGFYVDNLAEDCWERFYENGKLRSRVYYRKGEMNGPGETFFENGHLAQRGFFRAGKEDSLWNFYFESGRMKSVGGYRNGLQEGFWKYFHEDSTLRATAGFEKGRGIYQEFYSNGKLRMEGLLEGGVSDSIWRYYHENGNLKAIGHERAGERHGYWQFFFPNGNLSSEGHFSHNQKFGRWKYYHETGALSSEGDLDNDSKEGVWKFFFPSGGLMGEGNFSKGSGDYQEYYDNGKVKVRGRIENGLYEGLWQFFFEDGGLEGECRYRNGQGRFEGYYENGAPRMRGQMENGQKTGSWDLLGRDGKLIGHYKTFYDLIEPGQTLAPVAGRRQRNDTLSPGRPIINPGRPDFQYNRRKSRHFTSRVNELRGFIVAFNPFAVTLGSLPFGIEYYFQDRLGYELMFTLFRQPFFVNHSENAENKRIYTLGNAIDFRQKLYSADKGSGNFYFGQELRISSFNHQLYLSPTADSNGVARDFEGEEVRAELSLLIGNRLLRDYNRHRTLTLDLYAGIGFGYRHARIPDEMLVYNRLKTNKLTIPIRLGFNFGFLF
jgi:antitoxin component YwqK of YwqJK toxin-antitoxin module